jgi:hypothetical protein
MNQVPCQKLTLLGIIGFSPSDDKNKKIQARYIFWGNPKVWL